VQEEYIVLVEEPGSRYVGHLTPDTGTGQAIGQGIVGYLSENKAVVQSLDVIGCDGTSVNTGEKWRYSSHGEEIAKKTAVAHLFPTWERTASAPSYYGA